MKYFISTIFGLFFCLVPGYASCDDFSWHMFLPAFTRGCVEQQGTCNCIAGCYEGAFADNCPGSIITGSMNFVVNADCSFNSFSNYGVQSTGSFADNNGLKYTGSGITDSNGCGEFSFACTYNWYTADTSCKTIINGQAGWRLPTLPELTSLAQSGVIVGEGGVWSSTPTHVPTYHYYVSL